MRVYIQKLLEELKKIWRGINKLRFFRFADVAKIFEEMSKRERIATASLVAVLIVDLVAMGIHWYVGHTVKVPAHGGEYIEGLVGQPQYINPLLAQTPTDRALSSIVYDSLYDTDSSGNLVPSLADGPIQISADGKQYTIKLKPNLKWQDGKTLNADDVAFTFTTIQNQDYHAVERRQWANIAVQKIDDLTVQFTNKNISAPFITNFTVGILPQHIWQNVSAAAFSTSRFNLEPIGSGPFTASEKDVEAATGKVTAYDLSANPLYREGAPYIDTIEFKFYASYADAVLALHGNEIEGLGFSPFDTGMSLDQKHTNLKVGEVPVYEYQALFFNLPNSQGILSDSTVRSALAQSVNRGDIISSIYGGLALPDYGPLMPGQLGYKDESSVNALNVKAATDALTASGWVPDPSTGTRQKGKQQLKFTITTNDFVLNVKTAENLQQQWKQIGADAEINVVPTADIQAKVIQPRNYQALLFAEGTGVDPDPFVFWHSSQAEDPGANLALYKNTSADALISSARNTFDKTVRAADYQKFQDTLAADSPAIFLVQSEYVYETTQALRASLPATLANPENRFYDIQHWYVKETRTFKKK